MCDQQSLRSAVHTLSLIRAFVSRLNIICVNYKPLTEHHFEFLNLKGGCTGSSKSTLVKMPYCWKSHVTAQIISSRQKGTLRGRIRKDSSLFFYLFFFFFSLVSFLSSFFFFFFLGGGGGLGGSFLFVVFFLGVGDPGTPWVDTRSVSGLLPDNTGSQ